MDKIKEVVNNECKYAVFPIVCADHCAYLLNLNLAEAACNGDKLARVLKHGRQLYNYDMILVFSDPYVEAEAMGCRVEFRPYPAICPSENVTRDRTSVIIKASSILKEDEDVPVFASVKGPFSLASFLGGVENFLKMLVNNKNGAQELIKRATDFQLEYLNRLLEIDVDIFIGDPVASASVISPETFRKFAYEPLKTMVKKVSDSGKMCGVHVCGDSKPIISDLDELGADILSVEDITIETKTLKMGGVRSETILSGNRDAIRDEVKKAMTESHLILATSCDVSPVTDPESIKFMIETGNEFNQD